VGLTGHYRPAVGRQPLRVEIGTMTPEEEATITFQVDVGDTGQACWFVPNLAVIAATGTQWTSGAVTTIGACNRIFAPVVFRRY